VAGRQKHRIVTGGRCAPAHDGDGPDASRHARPETQADPIGGHPPSTCPPQNRGAAA
jgi:hypothetical protein